MPKKPRMPKNVSPAEQDPDVDDEAVITDEPNRVTKITKNTPAEEPVTEQSGKQQADDTPANEPVETHQAPRSRMRERLIATAKQAQSNKKAKKRNTKQIDDDIWNRGNRVESFKNEPEPAREFSGRTVALLAVLFVAALIMAQPLQLLLEQQSEITKAQEQLQQQQEREQELETQLERWDDPAYVEQQARERFNMVMPGERKYMVIDEDADDETQEPDPVVAPLEDEEIEMGWADRLWGSVLSSGQG